MTANDYIQCILYMAAVLGLAWPVGIYMARVYEGRAPLLEKPLGPIERAIYKVCGVERS